jgi:hypothetical protein
MNVYQDKQGKLRVERRVSTIADRRVKTPMARLGGTRAGLDNNYMEDMPYVVIGADRRAKTTNTDDLTEGCPIEPPNPSDTAELLKKYRAALITAYELGKKVKETYQIVPPKVVISSLVTIGLQVN